MNKIGCSKNFISGKGSCLQRSEAKFIIAERFDHYAAITSTSSIAIAAKIYQNCNFWSENIQSGNPGCSRWLRPKYRENN
jgi:hypothetical protein